MLQPLAVSAKRLFKSPAVGQIAAWYLFILVPTLALKWLFIQGYASGPARPLQSWSHLALGSDPRLVHRVVRLFFVFRPDILEVLLLVMVAFVLGRLALRIGWRYLTAGTLLLCLLIGVANFVASSQVGTLLTMDLLSISWHWGRENPAVVGEFLSPHTILSPHKIAGYAMVGLWFWCLVRLSDPAPSNRLARVAQETAVVATFGLVVTALLTPGPILPHLNRHGPDAGAARLGGYWSSTIISLLGRKVGDPREIPIPTALRLEQDYQNLVYPGGRPPKPDYLLPFDSLNRKPRHVIIIELETAPRKYYPFVDNPDFPAFYELSKHALISDRHYTTAPYTTYAIYSILSGTYPRPGKDLSHFGRFSSDGLAAVLGKHGYTTAYVDSYPIDWTGGKDNRHSLEDLGFQKFFEPPQADESSYEGWVQREKNSFESALQTVLAADRQGNKALVFVSTTIGHFPWRSSAADEGRSATEKLAQLAHLIDDLVGSLVRSLNQHGLGDDVMLLVTGDHGLRYEAEFASVNEPMEIGGPAFNVPLILYAPGIFSKPVRLPYATSHIDIAPTLLTLDGIATEGLMLQGDNMLDQRVSHRLTFLMNRDLTPVDGFYWEQRYFTADHLAGTTDSRPVEWSEQPLAGFPPSFDGKPWSDRNIEGLVARGYEIANQTGAYLLRRKPLHSLVKQ